VGINQESGSADLYEREQVQIRACHDEGSQSEPLSYSYLGIIFGPLIAIVTHAINFGRAGPVRRNVHITAGLTNINIGTSV